MRTLDCSAVVFDQTRLLIAKKKDTNDLLIIASMISKAFLDYKFKVDAVPEFQVGYKNARNKESFLKTYATVSREKPSIDEQFKAVVVHVLLENGLGYKYGTSGKGKDVVERAIRLAVALFKFTHEHRNLIIRNQRTRFGIPILKEIREAIFTKVERSGKMRN